MKQLFNYSCIALILTIYSCNTHVEKPPSNGAEFFPLTVGKIWVYDVSEIIYDSLIQNKKKTYQEQYEIVDQIKSQLSEDTYVIYISTRSDESSPWVYSQTWSAKISVLKEVIVNEENIAYLKILLPIRDGLSWKGNKYNTIESLRTNGRIDDFTIKDFKKPYKEFNSTFKVEESNDVNLSYSDIRYSLYAENVGLVYRINQYIEYCDQSDCFGQGIKKHEVTKIETLKSYDFK